MRRVHIDFAPPGLRRTLFHTPRAAWGLFWLCICAALLLLSNGVHYARQLKAHAERVQAHERAIAAREREDRPSAPGWRP
jgi:hypothetical protein